MAEQAETASSSSSSSRSPEQPSSGPPPSKPNVKQQRQFPAFGGIQVFGDGDHQVVPVMYPAYVAGANACDDRQQMNHGAGLYAVPVLPYNGVPTNTLIPLTYNIPTTRASTGAGAVGDHGQGAQEQQQPGHQRLGVRRFQIAFQLDLLLILKLAAVIFVFNQDGSRLRLVALVFFASLIYLYQTGALTPLLRWLSQSMHRAAQPPHPPRPAGRAENVPAAARQGNENAALGERQAGAENENQPLNDGNRAVENENVLEPGANAGNRAVENENVLEPGANAGNQWWGIVKEIQMIVFGFITSLLPGFHNID